MLHYQVRPAFSAIIAIVSSASALLSPLEWGLMPALSAESQPSPVTDSSLTQISLTQISLIHSALTHPALTVVAIDETEPTPEEGVPDYLRKGQEHYERGALQAAQTTWSEALAVVTTPDLTIAALNALAIVEQDLGDWDSAAARLTQAQILLNAQPQGLLQAQVWNTQANFAFRQGQSREALTLWQQASSLYQSLGDGEGAVLSALNQVYALQSLGFYDRARKHLDTLRETIADLPASPVRVNALSSLGDILKGFGRNLEAAIVLEEAFSLASQGGFQVLLADILLKQGNLYSSLAKDSDSQTTQAQGLDYFAQVYRLHPPLPVELETRLSEFRLLLKLKRPAQALELLPILEEQLAQLSPSRFSVSARINLAESLMQARQSGLISSPLRPFRWPDPQTIATLLGAAVQDARLLGEPRLHSFALGQLGHLYELNEQYPEALALTEQALHLAQTVRAEDALSLWQWQQGRILNIQGESDAALQAYQDAVQTLEGLRQDLVTTTPDVQFSFRKSVEPVYRELTALLLENLEQQPPAEQQRRLHQARATIEALQLAELDNFFREACLDFQAQSIDSLDPNAAVIYPILLRNSVEVIVSLPDGSLRHHRLAVKETQRKNLLKTIRQAFNIALPSDRVLPGGTTLYDWLIRPVDQVLLDQGVETIVFVLDGSLRNIPMSILHDGQQFLVERYNLALAPGLQLLQPTQPKAAKHSTDQPLTTLKAFLGGLSEARDGFPELPNVQLEIQELSTLMQTDSVLLNTDFTEIQVTRKLRDYPAAIVHLATHGQFSSDAEQTFLLTWDGQINVRVLDQLLKERSSSPIELLVLSACQTAQGDDQAILGLAGIAVRSGAQSTLGTLWPISDRSTAEFMTHFYQNLAAGQDRAQALRKAQITLLHSEEYAHPYYWAPFILIGQWN